MSFAKGPMILSIDGNIGSGKSTLVTKLRERLKDNKDVVFVDEPVKEWEDIKDATGSNMIKKFYGNVKKYAFAFQMMAYISRLAKLKEVYKKAVDNGTSLIITERSVETDRMVFAQMLHDDGNIEDVEFQIYNKWFEHFIQDLKVNCYVYINADSTTCDERIRHRNRAGEVIPVEYLARCQKYHEKWLYNLDIESLVVTLDGSRDIYADTSLLSEWCGIISDRLGVSL